MQTVTLPTIEVDSSILVSLKSSAEELAYKMKFYTAIVLYQKRHLSLGKSAELVGLNRLEFIEALDKENIPIFDYSTQEMQEVVDDAKSLSEMLK